MTKEIIDKYLRGYLVYHYKGWYWVLHPETNEWIVNVSDSGYTFFNRDFWKTISYFFPPKDLTNDIHGWVIYKLGVPMGKHCYPDYIPHDYNWKYEFSNDKIDDVVSKGNICFSIT